MTVLNVSHAFTLMSTIHFRILEVHHPYDNFRILCLSLCVVSVEKTRRPNFIFSFGSAQFLKLVVKMKA